MSIEEIARELLAAAKLYDKTYASTQTHPTVIEEARVIMAMRTAIKSAETVLAS